MSISRRMKMDGRPPSIFIQVLKTSSIILPRRGRMMEEVFRTFSLRSTRTTRYARSLAVHLVVILPPSGGLLPPLPGSSSLVFPLRGNRASRETLRVALAAACFWPFSPKGEIRPKNILGRAAAFRGGAFSGPLFFGLVFF